MFSPPLGGLGNRLTVARPRRHLSCRKFSAVAITAGHNAGAALCRASARIMVALCRPRDAGPALMQSQNRNLILFVLFTFVILTGYQWAKHKIWPPPQT